MKNHDSLFLGSIAFLLPIITSFVAIVVAWLFFGDIRDDDAVTNERTCAYNYGDLNYNAYLAFS